MSTQKTISASHSGHLDLNLPTGLARVTVDPKATVAMVTIHTDDDHGPAADAVRSVRSGEGPAEGGEALTVTVPEMQGDVTVIGNRNGNLTINQRMGTVARGATVIGLQVNGSIGGPGWARQGFTTTGPTLASAITATVILPPTGALVLRTSSADLVGTGPLLAVGVTSSSGDVILESVEILAVETSSGDVEVGRVGNRMLVQSSSGDVEISAYEGSDAAVQTSSGDVQIIALPRSTGALDIATSSGDILVRGAGHLQLGTATHSGDIRRR
ncbi:DUF4097 family beta strand repeat-containing protein [Kitasatospora sp. HPMI-4]|uniref:DUF4097 family beta strand repeat-containing protein n=1 Tax=Kitasatospora sp. HPMI-4 TaxID=3448443 RepID=UPI003F1A52E8